MSIPESILAKVPPGGSAEDVATERTFVANLLARPALLDEPEVAAVSPEDCYKKRHALLFKLALRRGPHRPPASLEEVRTYLVSRDVTEVSWVLELMEHGWGDWRWAANRVRENAVRRMVIREAASLQALAYDPGCREPTTVLATATSRLAGLIGLGEESDVKTLAELSGEFLQDLDRTMREGSECYPTGFPDIDTLLGGGLQPGDLTIIGARPSCGKTSLGRQIARNLAFGGIRSVFFSLEVPRKQVYRDVITGESGIPAQVLRSGQLNQNQAGRVADHANWLSENQAGSNLGIVERVNQLGRILAISRAQARLHSTKVVFVDYLQLVRVPGSKDKRYETSEVSARLKQLGLEQNLAVVALAQLARKADEDPNRIPRMGDLKESGSIEQDADQIMLLHRPDLAAQRGGKSKAGAVPAGHAQLVVCKNRSGPLGTVPLSFEGRSMKFKQLEPGPPAQESWKPRKRK